MAMNYRIRKIQFFSGFCMMSVQIKLVQGEMKEMFVPAVLERYSENSDRLWPLPEYITV